MRGAVANLAHEEVVLEIAWEDNVLDTNGTRMTLKAERDAAEGRYLERG